MTIPARQRRDLWTAERIAQLKQLVAEGLSGAQIARRMGAGLTRNAVIGKAYRLGLTNRARPARRGRKANRNRKMNKIREGKVKKESIVARLLSTSTPLPSDDSTDIARTTVADREPHQSRWVVGDPVEMRMCGDERVLGLPYCRKHSARAFRLPESTGGPFILKDKAELMKAREKEPA